MNLNSLFFGIFLPKILVNCGASLDYFYARFASLGVVVSFLSHKHWPDTPEVPRLIFLQISCLNFLPTSCEFLTRIRPASTELLHARRLPDLSACRTAI